MSQVMFFDSNNPKIGLHTRHITVGNEYELVKQFIDYYCGTFLRNNKKTKLAVFIEPRIESGFPDVVFASYSPAIIDNWSDKRELLDIYDLKLLSYLYNIEKASGHNLVSKLGFPEKQTLSSLEKLMDARLISYKGKGWRVNKLRNAFSIKKLIAVEAKMNNISKVIDQTHMNTWFASHSYALTNSSNPQKETIKTFSRYGLGLYCKNSSFNKVLEAKQFILPSSYMSLQFNEWIGKAVANQGGN